jgi:hypothetical protein
MDIQVPDDWHYTRVKEDLDRGRLWKARDRLQGRLVEEPANQEVLGLLGEVCFAMSDLPQAGRYWWLTDRSDDRARDARKAFTERFGETAIEILRALPRPTDPDRYPEAVRPRLEKVIDAARADGRVWKPPARRPVEEWHDEQPTVYRPTWQDRLTSNEDVVGAIAIGVLVFAFIGFVAVIRTVIELVG